MTHQVTVRYADGVTRTMQVAPDETILDAAESHGVPIVNECQSGVCGTCVGRCVSGRYSLGHVPGLSTDERDSGRMLSCQTLVESDCTLEFDYPFAGNSAHLVCGIAKIVELERMAPGTMRLVLDISDLDEPLTYKPGQFAQIKVPGTNAWRSYSYLTGSARDGAIEFLIRLQPDGLMSEYLTRRAQPGDTLDFRGSKGGFYLRETTAPVLLVAGGTGLSGILAIAERLAERGHTAPVRLLYGVTDARDLVLCDRIEAIAERLPDFTWEAIVLNPSEGWAGKTGVVTDLLNAEDLRKGRTDLYLCGPAAMVEATRTWLEGQGIYDLDLYFERFVPTGRREGAGEQAQPRIDLNRIRREGRGVALVIGGSIAGMATAKALRAHYDKVIILEKDDVHRRREGRPGAAQGWHLHHLLIAGQRALDKVFPGVIDDMVEAGAFRVDMGEQYRLQLAGSWKKAAHGGVEIICAGRPIMEWAVRRRIDSEEGIEYRYGHEVVDLVLDTETNAVCGAVSNRDGETEVIAADFVVDASGKNTPVPALLEKHGFDTPEIEEDCINCFYSSMHHKVPAERAWDDKVMMISYAHRPYQTYYAAQFYVDQSRSVLCTSLVGYNCYDPPRNAEEFRAFAQRMPTPLIGEELEGLEPITDVLNFRYPEMRRYHYERAKNLPSGLVALGDSLSSADPVSGAGMTKALLELGELQKTLQSENHASAKLVHRFYRRAAKLEDQVWFVIREQNLRYPWIKDVEKKRPFYFGALNWYVDRVFELLHEDPAMYRLYLSMTHFVSPPTVLMRPDVVAKVLGKWIGTKLAGRPTLIERNFKQPGAEAHKLAHTGRGAAAE